MVSDLGTAQPAYWVCAIRVLHDLLHEFGDMLVAIWEYCMELRNLRCACGLCLYLQPRTGTPYNSQRALYLQSRSSKHAVHFSMQVLQARESALRSLL